MQGMSERQYAAHVGLSRGAIQKAKAAGRQVLFPDGSIDAAGSDACRAAMTDPSKQRGDPLQQSMKPVPDAALSAIGGTLRENGLTTSATGDGTTFLQAKPAKFFPVGARGVFQTAWSPTEFFDFVNTPGRDLYAITIPDRDRNAWVRVELYSYPLYICTRPEMLLRAKRA